MSQHFFAGLDAVFVDAKSQRSVAAVLVLIERERVLCLVPAKAEIGVNIIVADTDKDKPSIQCGLVWVASKGIKAAAEAQQPTTT